MAIFMSNFVSPSNFMIFPLIGSLFFSLVKKVTKVWILLHFASKHQNTFFLTTLLTLASINQQAFFVQILGFYILLSSGITSRKENVVFRIETSSSPFCCQIFFQEVKNERDSFCKLCALVFFDKDLIFLAMQMRGLLSLSG